MFEYVVISFFIFFSAEGIVIRNSGPADISQSRGSGTESRTFIGKFNIGLSYVAHAAFYFEWQLCCALQVKQELQEASRQAENEKSAQSTQVNTGCVYLCILCACLLYIMFRIAWRPFSGMLFSVFSSSSTCTSCVHVYICCVWVL